MTLPRKPDEPSATAEPIGLPPRQTPDAGFPPRVVPEPRPPVLVPGPDLPRPVAPAPNELDHPASEAETKG